MVKRIVSSIIALPILIAIVAVGGVSLQLFTMSLALIGLNELYIAFSSKFKPIHIFGYVFTIIYFYKADAIINESNLFNVFVSIFIIVLMVYMVVFHEKTSITEVLVTFFGYFYVPFIISHIYLIREFTYGKFFVWLIFITAWGCDTGAYFTGITIGRHKLIPFLSPKKTVEGAVGGVIVATTLAVVYGYAVEKYYPLEGVNTILLCAIVGVAGSMLSQIGDLAASTIKRYTGIKDFGKLIPGHGGILDRFDSIIMTAPVVYYLMLFLINMNN